MNHTGGCHVLIRRSPHKKSTGRKSGIVSSINNDQLHTGQKTRPVKKKFTESVYKLWMHFHFSTFKVDLKP